MVPYKSLEELPTSVQRSLPDQAQEIYRDVFNSAWEEYARPGDRHGNDSRGEVAHKVAWSAVTRCYEKRDGSWVEKKHNA
jgi:cation transport regulator